eukprot:6181671-Pleurochrysis_carterae.AAC.1
MQVRRGLHSRLARGSDISPLEESPSTVTFFQCASLGCSSDSAHVCLPVKASCPRPRVGGSLIGIPSAAHRSLFGFLVGLMLCSRVGVNIPQPKTIKCGLRP